MIEYTFFFFFNPDVISVFDHQRATSGVRLQRFSSTVRVRGNSFYLNYLYIFVTEIVLSSKNRPNLVYDYFFSPIVLNLFIYICKGGY